VDRRSYLTRGGVFTVHNNHLWARDNPHTIRESGDKFPFSVSVHGWNSRRHCHGPFPYLAPDTLSAQRYRDFLETVLPGLLEGVPLAVRHRLWFQHDGGSNALWGSCPAMTERDIFKKVNWMSRADCTTFSVTRSHSDELFSSMQSLSGL
jgi:hypothetical protein